MQSFETRRGMREMIRMNLILNAQCAMELELPNIDAKNGQIHGNLLTAVASTSLTDTSCCLRGTPWIPSGHHLPHEPLGHQSNMQALGPKKNFGVTEHKWE